MTGLWVTDFCHAPRPEKVLYFGWWVGEGGGAKQVDQTSAPQTFIAKQFTHTHTHRSLTHNSHMDMDADIHMHTPIYMHSLGLSHANLPVQHKVKQK